MRFFIALASMLVLTLGPFAYQVSLRNPTKVDFRSLTENLDLLVLEPTGWQSADAPFEFGDDWKDRLGLRHHRAVQLTSPEGRRQTVLLMLSETGEQLYHTPEICYHSHGCAVRGESVPMPIPKSVGGTIRAVEVSLKRLDETAYATVAYGYWVEKTWLSPPQTTILNEMGRQPYLLKIQIMLEGQKVDEPGTLPMLESYLDFLSEQLRAHKL